MGWPVSADPLRFDEATAWFESLFPITEELRDQLGEYAGKRAWTIAGVAQLDVLLFVWTALLNAIEENRPYNDFRKEVAPKLTAAWGMNSPREGVGNRIETIFRTNVQKAYNRGRWVQQTDPVVTKRRPYLMYDALLDTRTTPLCKGLDKTTLPHDDPWWRTHLPPLHHRCRSSLRNLTKAQALERGITTIPSGERGDSGFGETPDLEAEWQPDPNKYPPELLERFARKQEAANG